MDVVHTIAKSVKEGGHNMIRWGIIGAGNIAHRFVKGLSYQENACLQAVACRTLEKAKAFQKEHDCCSVYDNYMALLEDENVDAVYIALPHLYHYEWSKQALRHHKAVLCEKPAMMNAREMAEIEELAKHEQVFFMEAMKTRFVPMYQEVKEIIKKETIGEITKISTSLCNDVPYQDGVYHYEPGQGGCLLDTGIYNMSYLAEYFKGDFTVKEVEAKFHENGVDIYVCATIDFAGRIGILECAFDRKKENQTIIEGTKGKIVIHQLHRPTDIEVSTQEGNYIKHLDYIHDDFYGQIHHVCTCIENNIKESDVVSLQDSKFMASVLDAIRRKMDTCK